MKRYKRNGKPKKGSRFICLKCLKMDGCTCNGIQRIWGLREGDHRKTQWCAFCKEEVRALEVREIDYLPDKMEIANMLHDKYYGNENKCLV